jgi:tetratricopeptide (TPR) repeat protein
MMLEQSVMLVLVIVGLVAVLVAGIALYFAFAPTPRRRRALSRAQKGLDSGNWKEALALTEAMLPAVARHPAWQARFRNLAGECHQRAVDQALKERDFDAALDHALKAAGLLSLDETEQRSRIVEVILAEVRRTFAAGPAEAKTLRDLVNRAARVCGYEPPEGTFWLALSEVREGDLEEALVDMTRAQEQVGRQILDPSFYVGVLLHRLGRPQEGLRYLGEANRIDAGCPFITWQMGVSLVGSGGDSGVAVRALQRVLSNRGLGLWQDHPERAWVEGFPEGRSYVRRLASKYPYVCPLLGGDLGVIVRQGQMALAQALYRMDRFQEAADLYGKLLQESPPTVMLMRGYGLALARLGLYDQAYKYLRSALEQEEPKAPFTAAYLALCGALGKPTNADDKPKNITWALRLLARYPIMGNAEWAGLVASVHAEARKVGVALDASDQVLLCDALASVQSTHAAAAEAYAHLASTFPDSLQPIHAWLYSRAATVHGVVAPCDLDLFARTFQEPAKARSFFEQQKWDFAETEYTYLQRSAKLLPGQFPPVLGPEYPRRGEAFLLARSRQQEEAGQQDPARAAVELLLQLAPTSLAAHDRLACLHYRQGQLDQAVAVLDGWRRLAPTDHWPLVRQAIIEQERGNAQRRAEAIDRALGLTKGPLRSSVAFLGARLALREGAPALDAPRRLLEECLRDTPDHVDALWCLAAVRSVQGDREGVASLAGAMDRPTVTDARFHFLGAVCNLAARKYKQVVELAGRAARDQSLEVESRFVMAWAHLNLGELEAAQQALRKVAGEPKSPSAVYARALLGQLSLQKDNHDEAVQWWSTVDAASRARWQLDEPLRQSVLLSGLLSLQEKRFEQAAERFREASKLGLRDRRLASLITLALVKAGQRLLYDHAGPNHAEARRRKAE